MKQNREYQEILDYMGMRKLPKGFEEEGRARRIVGTEQQNEVDPVGDAIGRQTVVPSAVVTVRS